MSLFVSEKNITLHASTAAVKILADLNQHVL